MQFQNQYNNRSCWLRPSLALAGFGFAVGCAVPALGQDAPVVNVVPPQSPTAVPATVPDAATVLTPDAAEPTIAAGEIRLDGTVETVDAAQSTLVISVAAFTLPNGKSQVVTPVKQKTVVVAAATIIHPGGDTATHTALADLAAGTLVSVIGKDTGTGKNLVAREIVVAATPAVGDVTVPDFAAQIQALRADVDALKAAAAPATGATPATDNTMTKAQVNALIAALRREFAVELQRLSQRLDKLEVAGKPAGLAPAAR